MNYAVVPVILLLIPFILLLFLIIRFNKGKRKAQIQWQQSSVKKISGFGATKSLEILPLIDWHTNRSDLKVETGISYLIKTDNNSILFDTGLNFEQSDPSPLMYNMGKMGISRDDIDSIIISHNHLDHVGGLKWQKQKTFSLSAHQTDLGKKAVYTPIPMIYPGLSPICPKSNCYRKWSCYNWYNTQPGFLFRMDTGTINSNKCRRKRYRAYYRMRSPDFT